MAEEITRLEMPFTANELSEKVKCLNEIYKRINTMGDDVALPAEMARKITLYSTAQGIIGELYAQAVYDHGAAYNERKAAFLNAKESFYGTEKDKEAYAERQVVEIRKKENKAKAVMKRWELAYNSTEQLANALKKELEILFDDFRQGGRPQ